MRIAAPAFIAKSFKVMLTAEKYLNIRFIFTILLHR
jgi:hypothetical protein